MKQLDIEAVQVSPRGMGMSSGVLTEEAVTNSFVQSPAINLFWKDTEGRFVGANQNFLNICGLESVDQIAGKTDAELGWDLSDEVTGPGDERVLSQGISVVNQIGKATVQGTTHNILVNKGPVIEEGAIVGMWCQVVAIEEISIEGGSGSALRIIDPVTGVQTARGILPVVLDYIDGYRHHGEDFAVITMRLSGVGALREREGDQAAEELLHALGTVLKGAASVRGTVGILPSGVFATYLRNASREETHALCSRVREQVEAVTEGSGVSAELTVSLASDSRDMEDLLWRSLFLAVFKRIDDFDRYYHQREMVTETLDSLPCAVCVYSRDTDGTIRRDYVSHAVRELTGETDTMRATEQDIISLVHPDDRDWVVAKIHESTAAHRGLDECYRIVNLKGQTLWIHHTSKAVPQDDGSCLFFAVYADVTEQTLVEEQRKAALAERYGAYFNGSFNPASLKSVLSVADFQGAMLSSIANVYIGMFVVNLHDDSFVSISCMDYVDRALAGVTTAQAGFDHIAATMVTPESQDEANAFFDLKTLPHRLEGRSIISYDYNGIVTGWCRASFVPVRNDEEGNLQEVIFVVEHIQNEKLREEELRKLSQVDGLSQLYNRAGGEEKINDLLGHGQGGLFLICDVDDFKTINDTYGHVTGDGVIRTIGACMRQCFRGNDIPVRLGGDEFGAFLPGQFTPEATSAIVARLVRSVGEATIEGMDGRVGVSCGTINCRSGEFREFAPLYAEADAMMYEVKKARKEAASAGKIETGELLNVLEDGDADDAQGLMEYLGRTLGAERSYIFELNEASEWDNTYEWCAEGVEPQIENLQSIPLETTEVWNREFAAGRLVALHSIEEMRETDPEMYEILAPQGISSIIVGPIYRGGRLHGFYGIDNPNPEKLDEIASMLDTVRHIVSMTIEKRDVLRKLR